MRYLLIGVLLALIPFTAWAGEGLTPEPPPATPTAQTPVPAFPFVPIRYSFLPFFSNATTCDMYIREVWFMECAK